LIASEYSATDYGSEKFEHLKSLEGLPYSVYSNE